MKLRLPFFAALALVGCGGAGGTSASPASTTSSSNAALRDVRLPTPYTSEEIRCNSEQGLRLDYWVDVPGKGREVQMTGFIAVDAEGADFEHNTIDMTGHLVGTSERKHATWAELRDHAAFPTATTKTREESTTVPAGMFRCTVYERVDPDGGSETFWFAKTMPGPPVRMQTRRAGAVVEERQLARLIRGSAGAPQNCPKKPPAP